MEGMGAKNVRRFPRGNAIVAGACEGKPGRKRESFLFLRGRRFLPRHGGGREGVRKEQEEEEEEVKKPEKGSLSIVIKKL